MDTQVVTAIPVAAVAVEAVTERMAATAATVAPAVWATF
jgi:hypothetical protein